MSGYAVEPANTVEVVAAWAVPQSVVTAVGAAPGWTSLGEYFLPKNCVAQLELVGLVSSAGLTLTLRLWDVTNKAPVNGAASTTSQAPVRVLGTKVELTGNRTYQVQAQCVGSVGIDKFGVVQSATITD